MPISKLTLSADPEIIRQAKKMAAEEGTSISALFSRLVRAMIQSRAQQGSIAPITRKATGIIQLPETQSDEQLMEDALSHKYRIRK
jgi:hypothetical protein